MTGEASSFSRRSAETCGISMIGACSASAMLRARGCPRAAEDRFLEDVLAFESRSACASSGYCTSACGRTRLLHTIVHPAIVNHMVQYLDGHLDSSFAALSDATRRGVLDQLGRADASISELAEKFNMTLTGMKKHVGVLERAGLVSTEKVGRVRTCRLGPYRLDEETAWIERYRQLWAARFDELDAVVDELKQKEKRNGRNKR